MASSRQPPSCQRLTDHDGSTSVTPAISSRILPPSDYPAAVNMFITFIALALMTVAMVAAITFLIVGPRNRRR